MRDKQSDGEPVREDEAAHASLHALSRTRQDFGGDSSDRASEAQEGDPREGEGEKRYRRGKRRGKHRQEGEGNR